MKNTQKIPTKNLTVCKSEVQTEDVRNYFSEKLVLPTNTPRKKDQQATRTTKRRRGAKVGIQSWEKPGETTQKHNEHV